MYLGRDDETAEEGGRHNCSQTVVFSHSDEAILAGFALLVDRVADSLNNFLRPEYGKIAEVSGRKLATEWEEFREDLRLADPRQEFVLADQAGPGQKPRAKKSAGVPQDFEQLLYKGQEIGPEIYRKYLGRVQVQETTPKSKIGKIPQAAEGGGEAAVKDPKFLAITSSGEAHCEEVKAEILGTLRVHLKETKRVLEVFE